MVVGYTKGTWESLKCQVCTIWSCHHAIPFFLSRPRGVWGWGWKGEVGADLSSSMGWSSVGGILLLVVLVDCLSFVWCSSAINGLYRGLGGNGDGG